MDTLPGTNLGYSLFKLFSFDDGKFDSKSSLKILGFPS